ncbi:MAG TPA: hypothetical protein DCW42_00775 [Bacteroidetes bacterium]|nr:hypothetical protein [bacterium]HAW07702.1 hypothetical protein [Bacteroidota bacterium]
MKKYLVLFFVCSFALALFISCGKKEEEKLDEISMDEIIERGDKVDKQMDQAEKKLEERKKRGDTIATDYKVLLTFIPDITGWQAEKPEGTNLTVSGAQYSTASKSFKDAQNNEVSIELYDYNTSLGLMTSSSMWKNFGIESDNEESYQKVSQFADVKDSWVYEEINKVDKITNVNYSLNDRYFLSVTVSGQTNLNFAKEIAQQVINRGKSLFNK